MFVRNKGTYRLHVGDKIHEHIAITAEHLSEYLSEAMKAIVGKKE